MDRSYCSWARKLPATQSLVTTGMFLASGCSNTDDPDPANLASSPFCRNCVDISVQNTTDGPTVSPVNFTAYPPQPLLTSAELLEAVDAYLLDNSTFSDVFLKYGPIEFWDVGAISNFIDAKRNPAASTFNKDLNWDTSRATTMSAMFRGADLFNGNISSFNTSHVTDMSLIFQGALSFNGDISQWNTSSVQTLKEAFEESISFNGDLSLWQVHNVVDMSATFQYASAYNSEMSQWDTSNVELFFYTFSGAITFNKDISSWNVSSATSFIGMVRCY
jgi:surface protein